MAMDKDALGSALASAVEAAAKSSGSDPKKIWTAVADEIIKHIQANAVVSTVVTTSMGPGTGTGTVS